MWGEYTVPLSLDIPDFLELTPSAPDPLQTLQTRSHNPANIRFRLLILLLLSLLLLLLFDEIGTNVPGHQAYPLSMDIDNAPN